MGKKYYCVVIGGIVIRCCYLQYANFLSLTNKKSVIVDAIILAYTFIKQGEIKVAPALMRPPQLLGPFHIMN